MKTNAYVLAGMVVIAFSGCATSTPADRIAARQAEFASWPPEIRANVSAGIVAPGYNPDQVLVALGEPDGKSVAALPGNVTEVWIYNRRAPRFDFEIGGASFGRSSAVGGGVAVNGIKLGQDVGGRVVFKNGLVYEVEVMTR